MRSKKLLRITGISVLVIGILALAAHLFIVYRAKQILNYIVLEASNDRYMVKGGKVRFRYNPLTINAKALELVPVDSSREKTFYVTSADSVSIQVTNLFSLLGNQKFSLENVRIVHPLIKVFDRDTSQNVHKPLNEALDDIQHALLTTLTEFSIRNCRIDDGGITYVQNKTGIRPLHVNHIWLNMRNVLVAGRHSLNDSFASYKADITLKINKPFIQLPDPSTDLYVDNLLLDTRKNIFSINNLIVNYRNTNGTVDSVKLSEIRLQHFNWNRWLKEGLIELDSLKANNGATFLDFSEKKLVLKTGNKNSPSRKKQIIPFLIHHVEVKKINYSLRIGSAEGPSNLQLNGDSFAVGEISVSTDLLRPLKVGTLAFRVSDFIDNRDSKKNSSTFEKLIIDRNNLELFNYRRELDFGNIGAGSSITIPSLRVINFSLDDLLKYRLVADKLVLEKPALVLDAEQRRNRRNPDEIIATVMKSIRPSLDIKKLSIRDAAIDLLTGENNSGRIRIQELNTEFNAEKLLQSSSLLDLVSSATELNSSGFRINGPNIDLFIKRSILNKNQRGVFLQHVEGKIGRSLNLNLDGVFINNTKSHIDVTNLSTISLDEIKVDSGKISIGKMETNDNGKKMKTPDFNFGSLKTGPLQLHIVRTGFDIVLNDARISGNNIATMEKKVTWDYLNVSTGKAALQSGNLNLLASSLNVSEPGVSSFANLHVNFKQPGIIRKLFIPAVSLSTNFTSSKDIHYETEMMDIHNPSIEIVTNKEKKVLEGSASLPEIYIKKLLVTDPNISVMIGSDTSRQFFYAPGGIIDISDFNTNNLLKNIYASSIKLQLLNPVIQVKSGIFKPESVALKAGEVFYSVKKNSLTGFVDSVLLNNLDLKLKNKGSTSISHINAGLSSFIYSSNDSLNAGKIFNTSNWWAIADGIESQTAHHTLKIFHPFARQFTSFGFDSLKFVPNNSREEFWSLFPYEKDYIILKSGPLTAYNWLLKGDKFDDLHIESVSSYSVDLIAEKDKTRGPDDIKYRPLLANSLVKIPIHFGIDNYRIANGKVRSNIIAEKTKKEGSIFFTAINGTIYNLKNYDLLATDTLRFRLGARLMGEGDMMVGFRQSYMDSLQGFSLKARLTRFDLTLLNSILTPVSSIKIERGITDSVLLSVGANDYVAFGNMDMRYHGLKVALLKKGERKYFMSSFFNGIINALIRSNDNAAKNTVYIDRFHNKGIFNYWGRIAINGLLSNLGIKRDKMQIRKYNKAVKHGNVPAVDGGLL